MLYLFGKAWGDMTYTERIEVRITGNLSRALVSIPDKSKLIRMFLYSLANNVAENPRVRARVQEEWNQIMYKDIVKRDKLLYDLLQVAKLALIHGEGELKKALDNSPEEMKEIITGIFEAKIDNAERMRKILRRGKNADKDRKPIDILPDKGVQSKKRHKNRNK